MLKLLVVFEQVFMTNFFRLFCMLELSHRKEYCEITKNPHTTHRDFLFFSVIRRFICFSIKQKDCWPYRRPIDKPNRSDRWWEIVVPC